MNPLKLSALILATTAMVTGCGSPRSLSVAPGTRLATTTRPEPAPLEQPSFTMVLQGTPTTQAPLPCPGCIGVGYNSDASIPVQLTAVNGFIGTVKLCASGLPAGVVLAQPIAPVLLNVGNGAANQVILAELFVQPGVNPGSYGFTVTATPAPGANSTTPVSLPVTLTITSAWGAQ